jgi:defect-in-organelle-trafficking protein DotD
MNFNILILIVLFITGCASTTPYKKPPQNDPSDDASIKLAEAANSVSDSMIEMAKVEKIILPSRQDNSATIPNVQNLQTRASVDWSGPMAEVTEQIALAAHYRLRIIGRSPAIPVIISLNVKDQSLAEILRNIDYQAGKKATIRVYPNTQVVELRYAQFYS